MIIKKMHLDGFGVFNDFHLDGLHKGLNIIYGENEAGKSTLLDFVKMTLFDYPRLLAGRRPPLNGGLHGGKLFFTDSQKREWEIHRRGDPRSFVLYNHTEGVEFQDESVFKRLISNASDQLFNNVYAISLDQLVNMSSLNESGMQDRIYSMGMGLSGIDFGSFEQKLAKDGEKYYKKGGSIQEFSQLASDIQELEKKVAHLSGKVKVYDGLKFEQEELALHKTQLEENQQKTARKVDTLQAYQKSYDDFVKVMSCWEKLKDYSGLQRFPLDLKENYRTAVEKLDDLNVEVDQLKSEIASAEKRMKNLEVDAGLVEKIDELEFLKFNVNVYKENRNRLEQLQFGLSEKKKKFEDLSSSLGAEFDRDALLKLEGIKKLKFQAQNWSEKLREHKDGLRSCVQLLEEKLREGDQKETEITNLKKEIAAGSIKNEEEQKQAFERWSDLKLKLENLLNQASQRRGYTTITPYWIAVALALAMVAAGGLGIEFSPALGVAFIAVGLVAGIWIVVLMIKRTNRTSEDFPNLQEMNREKELLEKNLEDYEERLKRLVSRSTEMDLISQRIEELKAGRKEKEQLIEEIQAKWVDTLKSAKLPENIPVHRMGEVLNDVTTMKDWNREIIQSETEIETVEDQLEKFEDQLKQIYGGELKSGEEEKIARQLIVDLEKTQKNYEEKRSILKALEEKMTKLKASQNQSQKMGELIRSILKEVGAKDETAFYAHFERQEAHDKILAELAESEEKIQIKCGEDKLEEVLSYLNQTELSDLEENIKSLQKQSAELNQQIEDANQKIGSLKTQANELLKAGEDQLLQMELEKKLAELQTAYSNWLSVKMAQHIVSQCKKKYEEEKQPEVIKRTAAILNNITDQKYNNLKIDISNKEVTLYDSKGNRKRVGELSRGTKEQLLLALRLGLIEEYEQKAEPLPVLLDDVMVNFDSSRAERTAEVMHKFAENRQLILFTCHSHTLDLFGKTDSNIISVG